MPWSNFDDFYKDQFPALLVFLFTLGASPAEAEDVAQEAMVKVYLRWKSITHPYTYVRRTACRDYIRSAARTRLDNQRAERNRREDFVEYVDLAGEEHDVLVALAALPLAQREVMAWYYDGFKTNEISFIVEKGEETVRSLLRHARLRLQHELGAQDFRKPQEGGAS